MKKILLSIMCIILLLVTVTACTSGNSDSTVTSEISETAESSKNTTTNPSENVLPDYTVADVLLGKSKTLTVTDTHVILTVTLGLTETIQVSKTDLSITMKDSVAFKEVTFKDKTGTTIVINLTTTDYNKVINWLA